MSDTPQSLKEQLLDYIALHQIKARLVFWGGAVLVGLTSALFALGAEQADHLFRRLLVHSAYWPLLVTPLGMVAIAWLTRHYFSGAQGSGIPQSIAALELSADVHHLRSKVLSLRIAVGKILLTILGLLSGASIGREGPTVHIGAAIMYAVGHRARFPLHYLDHSLIVAGGAAGIAAAFNTPLAGIVFAIEEMARNFNERSSGVMLTSVVIAGITAMVILGNYTYFGTSHATMELGASWLLIPLIGISGGLLGGIFARLLVEGARRIGPQLARHPLLIPALCGLTVAVAGLIAGGTVYGTGYGEAKAAITGEGGIPASYPVMKMIATLASYFSGIPGGIFAPSLATGAGFGTLFAGIFTDYPAEAIIILVMVSYFTGVVQTPITAFVIVMEMTDNHTMLLPLMACAFFAYGSSKLICPEPIYRTLAAGFLHTMLEAKSEAGHEAPQEDGDAATGENGGLIEPRNN